MSLSHADLVHLFSKCHDELNGTEGESLEARILILNSYAQQVVDDKTSKKETKPAAKKGAKK